MILHLFISLIIFFSISKANSEKLDTIFTAPDVFITSKILPTKDYESDRGNILFEGNDIEFKKQYSIGGMLKDLPGISSQGLGNASRPIIRGMANSRVKILQNSSTLSDVSEFLHIEELGTLITDIVFCFNRLQCFNAASVSAVSPD